LNQLSQMDHLDDELKSIILTLISSGNQPSQYFNQHVSANFQLEELLPSEFKTGDLIDGYELLDELGVGGMARVYKAKKTDAETQKPVAIKLFNRSGLSPLLLNRFSIEQDVLSGLSHPNIVNMHHGGTSEQGVPYIVMELIGDAQDIDQYAQSHQANLKQKISWIVEAAKAIAYAHNNLIVHRDIKPSNLLIDSQGVLKVVDFGIAKLLTREDAPQKTTIMALTPSFAAPEQINSGHISVTTDVFSLAVVCLALIIEELPLPADRLLKSCSDDEAHIWQVLKNKVKDKDLRNILNRALQTDPVQRYRNMDLFADDLTAWLDDKPVLATPDSWMYRLRKFAKRRSALFAALSTLIAMVVVGIVLMGWQIEKTQAESAKAKEVKDFMLGVFSVVNPDDALGENILAKDLLSQSFAEIKVREFADLSTKVELLTAMGQAQFQLGLNQQASEAFAEALSIDSDAVSAQMGALKTVFASGDVDQSRVLIESIEQMEGIDISQQAELLLMKSRLASNEGEYELAEEQAIQAQAAFLEHENTKGYLDAGRQLTNIMYLQSESKDGADYLEQQLSYGLARLAPTSTIILAMQNDLVELYNDIGEYPQAIKHSEQLIENIKKVLGENHPFLIQAYISRAGTSRSIGEINEAKNFANMALELSTEVNGMQHETTARAMNLVAVIYYVNGEIELSLERMKEASELFDQVLGDDHPESWDVKTNLTALLNMTQRFDEAIQIIEPVLRKQTEVLGEAHKSTIYSQTVLARLYGDVGRLDEARVLGEDMLQVAIKDLGLDHPLTVGGHFSLAKIYQKLGDYSAGITLLETVTNSEGWSEKNERVITAYNTLADLYFDNKDLSQATAYKEKSLQIAIELLTENSPRTVAQMLRNVDYYIKSKDGAKAQDLLSQAAQLITPEIDPNNQLQTKLEELTTLLDTKDD
ncbi:MAG: protein kinase domain-containing protein, partial [Marinicella sp.]